MASRKNMFVRLVVAVVVVVVVSRVNKIFDNTTILTTNFELVSTKGGKKEKEK